MVQSLMMSINTRHFSFLEGESSHYSEDDSLGYRMHIHELRIGTFAALVGLMAVAICF